MENMLEELFEPLVQRFSGVLENFSMAYPSEVAQNGLSRPLGAGWDEAWEDVENSRLPRVP